MGKTSGKTILQMEKLKSREESICPKDSQWVAKAELGPWLQGHP